MLHVLNRVILLAQPILQMSAIKTCRPQRTETVMNCSFWNDIYPQAPYSWVVLPWTVRPVLWITNLISFPPASTEFHCWAALISWLICPCRAVKGHQPFYLTHRCCRLSSSGFSSGLLYYTWLWLGARAWFLCVSHALASISNIALLTSYLFIQ